LSEQEQAMFTHPYLSSQIASDRRREMLVKAEQQRLARQLRAQARASSTRASQTAGRAARLRWLLRIATARHTEIRA
jgi:hypothetical protein